MKYISFKEAKQIAIDEIDKYELGIIDSATIDFQWGTLFYIQSKEYIKTGKNPVIGNSPILVDKVNQSINTINYLESRDKLLEEYRVKKGYPHVIKFPVKGDLNKMTDLQKVFALMSTGEFIQIEQAIEIVKEKKLFDFQDGWQNNT